MLVTERTRRRRHLWDPPTATAPRPFGDRRSSWPAAARSPPSCSAAAWPRRHVQLRTRLEGRRPLTRPHTFAPPRARARNPLGSHGTPARAAGRGRDGRRAQYPAKGVPRSPLKRRPPRGSPRPTPRNRRNRRPKPGSKPRNRPTSKPKKKPKKPPADGRGRPSLGSFGQGCVAKRSRITSRRLTRRGALVPMTLGWALHEPRQQASRLGKVDTPSLALPQLRARMRWGVKYRGVARACCGECPARQPSGCTVRTT